ncbi:hypothetical protein EDD85DRAFT_793731 [Armillaria nabsnona]|nr:hypothetical protein EDD85DRAFT_793731 [Armillaria nabsnona]
MHAEDAFCWCDRPGPTQIVLSFNFKGVFRASGAPMNSGLRVSSHHQPHSRTDDDDPAHVLPRHESDPQPHPNAPSTSGIDIGTNRCQPRHPHATRACNAFGHWTSATISAREEQSNAELATTMMTNTTTATTVTTRRGRWTAGDVEDVGGMKIRTPTTKDDDDDRALWGIEGRLQGAQNAPRIIVLR